MSTPALDKSGRRGPDYSRLPPKISISTPNPYEAYPAHAAILEGSIPDFFAVEPTFHVICFSLKGTTTVTWKQGMRLFHKLNRPGSISISPAGCAGAYRTDHWSEVLCWFLPPELLTSQLKTEWDCGSNEIEVLHQLGRDDERLWRLGWSMSEEMRSPTFGTRLYIEMLTAQLGIEILRRYSNLRVSEPTGASSSDLTGLKEAIDFIHASLGEDVSLSRLGEVSGLNPSRLIAAFREAKGCTPYQYVLQQRVTRARELLEEPTLSISEIARKVGFLSQSHLTSTFRRLLRVTPAAYRREILGDGRCMANSSFAGSVTVGDPFDDRDDGV